MVCANKVVRFFALLADINGGNGNAFFRSEYVLVILLQLFEIGLGTSQSWCYHVITTGIRSDLGFFLPAELGIIFWYFL